MKMLQTIPDKCITCHNCESACSKLYFKEDNAKKSCIAISEEVYPPEMIVCNQCGTCAKICPTLALTINPQGVVILNKSLCIGCLMCVAVCPIQAMRFTENVYNPFKCIACGICTRTCPAEAIEIVTA